MKVSLLHATARPEKAVATMRKWIDAAQAPDGVEYIFVAEGDGASVINAALSDHPVIGPQIVSVSLNARSSAAAWEYAYRTSTSELLIQLSDDFNEPPHHWDARLISRMPADGSCVLRVSDGHRRDNLLTMLICNRAFAEAEGQFIPACYASVFSDGEVSLRAFKRGCVIDCRDLVFPHNHAWHNCGVEFDSVYQWQNRTEAYAQGMKLFTERNPDWRTATLPNGERIVDWL